MATAPRRSGFRPRPVDTYKKLPIVGSEEDLVYRDDEGNERHVGQLETVGVNGVRIGALLLLRRCVPRAPPIRARRARAGGR